VDHVRAGDDSAFEELYRRYRSRIAAFVRGQLRDDARAEDVTQETFFSALRRMRATDAPIAFKPWIYEIARNAAIDSYRRTSRAQEVSIHGDLLRPSDRSRLVGSGAPDLALLVKERWEHLRGAFDELPDTHHRVLIMRELEGLSYREIGERLELSRPAVESVLFRARRRLEREYEELDTGRRCDAMRSAIARLAEQAGTAADKRRLARHTRRCTSCRRRARQLGVDTHTRTRSVAARAAALLPLPAFLRRRAADVSQSGSGSAHNAPPLVDVVGPGTTQLGFALSERAAALVAAVALAGASGAMLAGGPASIHRGSSSASPAAKEHRQAPARAPRRESGGARFERPKSTRGAPRRDAAPRFRSAAPRSGSGAGPAAAQRSQPPSDAPPKPASGSGLDGLPDNLGLGNDGNGQGSPVDLNVDPVGAITGSLPSGANSPPPGPAPPAVSPPPPAMAAGQKPPGATHGTASGHHGTASGQRGTESGRSS
jgi:RNA polymerase sigma factor (sigma-70 family)